mgnify:CR=1 FL=1
MKTTVINNISTTSNKPEISKRDAAKAGLCWFAVELTAKTLSKQIGINALWAGISACLFAYPLAEMYEYAKQKKYDEFSKVSTAITSILMGFRLYIASRSHPKWKNIRFGDFF